MGRVAKVEIVDRQQVMYNLTVAEAHTFFVGQEQWLVHNACSTKLRAAMNLTDASKQAHHIVPGQLEGHALVQQAIAGGWNIDGAMNGIALSKANADALAAGTVAHRGPHTNYTDVVRGHLDNLYRDAQQQGWSQQRIVQELNNLITNTLVPHIQSLPAGTRLD